MRFAIGVDSRARSRGAIELAAWLRQHSRQDASLLAVHVLDQRVRVSLRDDLVDEVVSRAQRELEGALRDADASELAGNAHVAFGDTPEDGLAAAAREQDVDALLLGRIAPAHAVALQRLGRVARRLVRELPRPTVIVPPDLHRDAIGEGPVVLATDMHADSADAARFAQRLADSLGRPVIALHVMPPRDFAPDWGMGAGLARGPEQPDDAARLRGLTEWLAAQGCERAQPRVIAGDVVDTVLGVASTEHAPFIVTGSRQLGLAGRLFSSSVGVDLARLADRPIAVVPSIL
ncbi:MAG: universal stress protein [Nannocystaceae bacterium]